MSRPLPVRSRLGHEPHPQLPASTSGCAEEVHTLEMDPPPGYARDGWEGVIHHSDHGCQYTSLAYGQRLREAGADVVMTERVGSHGDAFWRDELPLMVAWAFGR